ncbi:hypothetical protein [Yinghuangia soli]|uniref:Uncharacterized protein n=1 Tax=Yinghuangia soli TaxID=2908204 RepID=A0AA41PZA2_9ACTN|nr:hypothetical protein [Yinghuangia soli]MCF2528683.1 hypothetical protein [Yinghuangia soli]
MPRPTETATLHQTRTALYEQLLGHLRAMGGPGGQAEIFGSVDFLPGECETDPLPRTMKRGYYTTMLLVNFVIPGGDQHSAFRAIRAQAERSGFAIRDFANPPSRPVATREGEPGYGTVDEWRVSGARSAGGGMTFAAYTVQPQTYGALSITSGCRLSPDPSEVYDYFYITDLPPTLPPTTLHPPPRPTFTPPATPTSNPSLPGPPPLTPTPGPTPAPGTAAAPNTSPLGHIRDALG